MATIPASEPHSAVHVHNDSILLAEVLLDLAERAQAYTNAAGVAIALIRGNDLFVRTSTGNAPEVGSTIPLSDAFIAECVRSRRPLTCRDLESDSRISPALRVLKTRSLMAIPVCEVRDVRGMMLVIAPLPNSFQPTHISILMTLSDIIAAKLREHESAAQVEIHLFDDPSEVPEIPAEPPASFCPPDMDQEESFDFEPPSAMPNPAMAMAAASGIFDSLPPLVPASSEPAYGTGLRPASPDSKTPETQTPVAPPVAAPAAVVPPPTAAPAPSIFDFMQAAAPPPVKPAAVSAPLPFDTPATPPPALNFELPSVPAPAPVISNVPIAAAPGPAAHVIPSVFEPPVPFAVKAPPVHPPTAAAAKPAVEPPPPVAPVLGSPQLPVTPGLAMMEEKIELRGRDPGLLTPAENQRRLKHRSFTASTLKPSVPTTSATTVPKSVSPKPAAITPFVVVDPAKPPLSEPAVAATALAPTVLSISPPTLSSLETSGETQAKRPWLAPAFAIAAVLVIAVGFWVHHVTSKEAPAPVIPVPSAKAAALPAVAPAPPEFTLTSKAAIKSAESAKPTKSANTEAAAPEPKREAEQPVIEIAAAKPKPEPQPEVAAPKLDLAVMRDPSIGSLSPVRVAVPAAPKSDLVPASLISRVTPTYPALARQFGVSGAVVLEVGIKQNGSVGAVRVIAGAVQLRQAAVDAVKQWKYKPATLNGEPIETSAQVKINFTR